MNKTAQLLNLHRAIKGKSKTARDSMLSTIKLLDIEFVRRKGRTFIKMHDGIIELMENELLTLETLIRENAINIADGNTPDFISKSAIEKLAAKRVGPAGTINEMLESNMNNLVRRVSNEMRRLNAEGYGTDEIRKAIIGDPKLGYSDGIMGKSVKGSEVLQRTAAVMSDEAAQDSMRRKDKDVVGYAWVSVLDSGTTITCADLNGREFYYDNSGAQPLPPQHIGCRSSTVPITKSGGVPEIESIHQFIKDNPDEAREMLGATRYKLVTEGRLRIDRFTDRHFQPLTIDQLKQKNAVAFRRIE